MTMVDIPPTLSPSVISQLAPMSTAILYCYLVPASYVLGSKEVNRQCNRRNIMPLLRIFIRDSHESYAFKTLPWDFSVSSRLSGQISALFFSSSKCILGWHLKCTPRSFSLIFLPVHIDNLPTARRQASFAFNAVSQIANKTVDHIRSPNLLNFGVHLNQRKHFSMQCTQLPKDVAFWKFPGFPRLSFM